MDSISGVGGGAPLPPQSSSTENWKLKNYNDAAYASAYHIEQYSEQIIQDFFHNNPPQNLIKPMMEIRQLFGAVGTGAPPSLETCEKFIQSAQKFLSLAEESHQVPAWATAGMQTSLSDFKYWVDSGEPGGN